MNILMKDVLLKTFVLKQLKDLGGTLNFTSSL